MAERIPFDEFMRRVRGLRKEWRDRPRTDGSLMELEESEAEETEAEEYVALIRHEGEDDT